MKILISAVHGGIYGFLHDGRKLIEIFPAEPEESNIPRPGDIYAGQVVNLAGGLEAAFVRFAKTTEEQKALHGNGYLAMHAGLKPGDYLPVQIAAAPAGTKPYRLDARITIAGQYAVAEEKRTGFGFSSRLPEEMKQTLKEALRQAFPEPEALPCGFIIRTAAEELLPPVDFRPEMPAGKDAPGGDEVTAYKAKNGVAEENVFALLAPLFAEIRTLADAIRRIRDTGLTRSTGTCLRKEPPDLYKRVRDLRPEEITLDLSSGLPEDYEEELRELLKVPEADTEKSGKVTAGREADDGLLCPVNPVRTEQGTLFEILGLRRSFDEAFARRVYLPCGGYLVIDRTEALTAVDVNSGKAEYKGRGNAAKAEEFRFRVNREAAEEAFHQLRLRNLSGMILIDFINMDAQHRELLAKFLRELARKDPLKAVFVDFTPLGLSEITRQKVGCETAELFRG